MVDEPNPAKALLGEGAERPVWQRHSDPWGEAYPPDVAAALGAGVESPPTEPPTKGDPPMAQLTTPTPKATVKPGVYTTEFIAMVAANAIAILNADKVWTFFSPTTSGLIMSVVTGAYALSRGWAKSGG